MCRPLSRWNPPFAACVIAALALLSIVRADEEPPPKEADPASKHLEFLKAAVARLQVTSPDLNDPAHLTFEEAPILRYNDPTREFFDAAVWRLGTEGRPVALLTLEMYRQSEGSNFLMHEFTSTTPSRIAIDTDLDVHWKPKPADLSMQPLPDAPPPADTPSRRLAQMRTLARRFSAEEEYEKVKTALRLLTQPIDRYDDAEAGILDGGLFALATGTNPEVVVLLEAGKDGWQYGLARMSSAEVRVSLDGRQIKVFPNFVSEGRGGNYYAEGYPVDVAW